MVAALLASALVRHLGRRVMSRAASALFVAGVATTGASPWLPAVSVAVLAAGLGAGVLNVLFLVITADASNDGERATKLAAVSFFWSLAMLVTPVLVGVAAAQIGIGSAFVSLALLLIAVGTLLPWLWRKAVGKVPSLRRHVGWLRALGGDVHV